MLHVCLRLDLHVTSVSLQNQEWWTHCWRQVKRLATNTNCTAAVQPHRRQHSLSPLSLQFREELASSLSAETKEGVLWYAGGGSADECFRVRTRWNKSDPLRD